MKTIKFTEEQYETLLDIISADFQREHENNDKNSTHETSYMKQDLDLMETIFKQSNSNESIYQHQQAILKHWEDVIEGDEQ